MSESRDFSMQLKPIGTIRTGFETLKDCPRSGRLNTAESLIEIDGEFSEGLRNIEMATHLFVLYWFDRSDRTSLLRDARGGAGVRGVFASRSPNRPNPVALSVVRLISRDGNRLRISGLDCLDGTRVVDLKPYVPDDDRIADAKIGWNYETGAPLSDGAHPEGCQCRPAAHS